MRRPVAVLLAAVALTAAIVISRSHAESDRVTRMPAVDSSGIALVYAESLSMERVRSIAPAESAAAAAQTKSALPIDIRGLAVRQAELDSTRSIRDQQRSDVLLSETLLGTSGVRDALDRANVTALEYFVLSRRLFIASGRWHDDEEERKLGETLRRTLSDPVQASDYRFVVDHHDELFALIPSLAKAGR